MEHCTYEYSIYSHERTHEVHAVVEISHFQGDKYLGSTKKLCFDLQHLRLTPRQLYYELVNGFPSYPVFDPKDFGGYTFNEIMNEIEVSDLWMIAEYNVGNDYGDIRFNFEYMDEATRKLYEETMQIIVAESKFSQKGTNRRGVIW